MPTIVRRNERSWAIELISEINLMLNGLDLKVKRAGGESTLSVNRTSMFPDVLLYADEGQTQILQGWELKCPDTPITDTVFINDAKRKAEALNLNSFFLWNFTQGDFYVKGENGSFERVRSWTETSHIRDRSQIGIHKAEWMRVIREVILEINEYFATGRIRTASLLSSLTDRLLAGLIERNREMTARALERGSLCSMRMEQWLKSWWSSVKLEYMKEESDMYSAYAKTVLLSWNNRILFAHIIKKYHNCARRVEEITEGCTPAMANEVFEDIMARGDFCNVFHSIPYDGMLPEEAWQDLLELNSFLTGNGIDGIEQADLQHVLEDTVLMSRREIRGQFTTPPPLAEFLCQISVEDWTGHCMDTCSGTGTIARALLNQKQRRGMDAAAAYGTTWISDKDSYPLQISNIGLTDIRAINIPIRLFRKNVFDLRTGEEILIKNPMDGSDLSVRLPALDAVVSNLPFVSANTVDAEERQNRKSVVSEVKAVSGVTLNEKGDLYTYIPFALHRLLKEGGRLGVVLSNSWLGTASGIRFFEALTFYYHIRSVVLSGSGRWFHNADVVTTVLVMEKKAPGEPDPEEKVDFCLLREDICSPQCKAETAQELIAKIVLRQETDDEKLRLKGWRLEEIRQTVSMGISQNALFHGIGWLEKMKAVLVPVTDVMEVKRGERRGKNELFYPEEGHTIEPEYIRPVLKSPRNLKNYIALPDRQAFCCCRSEEELAKRGDLGALMWIKKFENTTNEVGVPTPQALKKPNARWYEMDSGAKADMVTALNPNKRLFVARFEEPSFVDQRFTRLLMKRDLSELRWIHALLNTVYGMFAIEAVGFGRGLGVLDASSSNFRRIYMLDPDLLDEGQKEEILAAFEEVEKRGVMDAQKELNDPVRERFDRLVLKAYGRADCYEQIRDSLLSMQKTRLTVNSDR